MAELNEERPEALLTIPTLMSMLAEEQLAGRLDIRPATLVVSGEALADDMRRRMIDAWGCEPFQPYSSTEALILASESPERVGLHVSEDLLVLEVVDERDRPVPPGLPGHKVLVTSLVNRALPLIRYEIADAVVLAHGSDPSGRPYARIERVEGRNDDRLRFPAVGGGEVVVLPYRLRSPFATLPEVVQYQIVQERERLAVRVVLRPDAPNDVMARVAADMRNALEAAGAVPPQIDVEHVVALEREPGGSKLKVIRTVGPGPSV